MTYDPSPIDTSDVRLPEDLRPLVETLAEHIHDTWAQRRIDEGWTYGPKRDDTAQTHPGLVPYDALSETEKEYDRSTALETLRVIVKRGYRIHPPDGESQSEKT